MHKLNNDTIQATMQSWKCPGLALAIIKGEETIFQQNYGLRDIENNLPVTLETRFAMASVTKTIAAMTIALLVEDGKIEWDQPVCEYIPELILHDTYVSRHLTVRDILSHRTGLPRHDLAFWNIKELSRAEFIGKLRHLKFNLTFRERYQYNNLMYYAIAYLVEKLTGQRWEDFVQTRIFRPLEMNTSNFLPQPIQAGDASAQGYRLQNDTPKRLQAQEHTEVFPSSAGALFSTLGDMIQWIKLHLAGGRIGDINVISSTNLMQMHTPHTIIPVDGVKAGLHNHTMFMYGLGWFIEPYKGYTLIHHGGNTAGFSPTIGFIPQENLGIIILNNLDMTPLRDVLLYEMIDHILGLSKTDWNSKYHEVFDRLAQSGSRKNSTHKQSEESSKPASHSLVTYTGSYAADGYPDFQVRLIEDRLQACTINSLSWTELKHSHHNIFEWYIAPFDFWMKVQFFVDDIGDIQRVSIPVEPMVDAVIFSRKPIPLSDETRKAISGEYETDIDGVKFTISHRNQQVYASDADGIPVEIHPYRFNAQKLSFKTQHTYLDFMLNEGTVNRLVITVSDTVIEAFKN